MLSEEYLGPFDLSVSRLPKEPGASGWFGDRGEDAQLLSDTGGAALCYHITGDTSSTGTSGWGNAFHDGKFLKITKI